MLTATGRAVLIDLCNTILDNPDLSAGTHRRAWALRFKLGGYSFYTGATAHFAGGAR